MTTPHPSIRVVQNTAHNYTIIASAHRDETFLLKGEDHAAVGPDTTIAEYRKLCDTNDEIIQDGPISFRVVHAQDALQVVQIETLLKCNLTCAYCYCSAHKERTEHLEFDNIRQAILDAEEIGALCIDFTGGEFFLRKDWAELIDAARSAGLTVALHTNGTALTARNVARLTELGICRVQVSLDGHTPDLHNSIRGGNYSFENTIDGINRLKRVRIPVQVAVMVHRDNIDHFPELYAFFVSMRVRILVDMIAAFGSELDAKMGVTPKAFYEATIDAMRKSGGDKRIERSLKCGADMKWKLKHYQPPCGIGHSYMFITATGEMCICPQLTSREDAALFGGPNLTDMSLKEAWTVSEFFQRHRHQNCKNVETCPAGTVCRGGCRADAYADSLGDYRAPDLSECNQHKNPSNTWVDFDKRYKAGDFSLPDDAPAHAPELA